MSHSWSTSHSSGRCSTEFLSACVAEIEHTEVLMKTVIKLGNSGSPTETVYLHLQLGISLICDSKFKGSMAGFCL